ncbi:MAG: hypothetical protein Q7K54_01230 [Candidatus Parcubacteria bacterium]|nr:hypothetical protein [Candidatus Parcubacteria bacterium]
MARFDIFTRIPNTIGEMVDGDNLIITFDGGDTIEGFLHEEYKLTEVGLEFSAWDSGGYRESLNEDLRPASKDELLAKIRSGQMPLARWSNRKGLEFLNSVMNGVTEEEIHKRIAQVRDSLNKSRDIERIEAAARVFGL